MANCDLPLPAFGAERVPKFLQTRSSSRKKHIHCNSGSLLRQHHCLKITPLEIPEPSTLQHPWQTLPLPQASRKRTVPGQASLKWMFPQTFEVNRVERNQQSERVKTIRHMRNLGGSLLVHSGIDLGNRIRGRKVGLAYFRIINLPDSRHVPRVDNNTLIAPERICDQQLPSGILPAQKRTQPRNHALHARGIESGSCSALAIPLRVSPVAPS
jgi:hypothetical protein